MTWYTNQNKTQHNKLKQINAQTQTNALISLTRTITFWLTNKPTHQWTNQPPNQPTKSTCIYHLSTQALMRDQPNSVILAASKVNSNQPQPTLNRFAQGDGWCCCFSMFLLSMLLLMLLMMLLLLLLLVVGGGWWFCWRCTTTTTTVIGLATRAIIRTILLLSRSTRHCDIIWIYPPPSNSGKWRFIGIPY